MTTIAAIAACGDDGGSVMTDGGMPDMRQFDAPPGFTCDYTEQSDTTNDTSSAGGVTESTGITIGTRTILCGQLDHTHFEGGFMVDGDSFTLTAPADTDLIVRILAPGAQRLQFAGVDVYGMTGSFVGGLTYYGNHGVVSVRVPAGTFEILPFEFFDVQISDFVTFLI
jgi:hypothetical protein